MLAISSVFGEIAWASRELLEPENFTSLIQGIGLDREDVYITSVVQFFPPEKNIIRSVYSGTCGHRLHI